MSTSLRHFFAFPILFATLIFCAKSSTAQTNLYVDSATTVVSGTGASWSSPFKTVGAALSIANAAAASTRYTINVAKGTYYATGTQSGTNRDLAFTITRGGIAVLGGYPTGGGSRNALSNKTVLSGNIGSTGSSADNSYHVVIFAGMASTADSVTLDGFQISDGNANGTGIVTVNTQNIPRNQGAGIYLSAAANVNILMALQIQSNSGVNGGGIYSFNTSPVIDRCSISGNNATNNGGGIYQAGTDLIMYNSLVSGNAAVLAGGGLYATSSATGNFDIQQSTFASNNSNNGNGILANGITGSILNSIIWEGLGNGIATINSGGVTVTYSTVQGGQTGTGNLSTDPSFINQVPANTAPTLTGNYQLSPCSPAIEAGQNSAGISNQFDLAGGQRLVGNTIDQGAYELQTPPFNTISGDSTVCSGSSIQLANSVSGGTFSTSNINVATVNGASGQLTAVAAGTVIITYTTTTGNCVGSVTKTITVNAKPATPTITGSSNTCAGSSITLLGSPTGGTWSSRNPSIFTVQGAVLTGVSQGVDSVFYTITSTAGCSSKAAKAITINPAPPSTPIMGSGNVCVGDTLQFSHATAGGQWSTTGSNLGTITSAGTYTALSFGSLTITYAYPSGAFGCTATATKTIQNFAPPVVPPTTGNTNTCIGGFTQLINNTPNGVWASSNIAVATISPSGVVTGVTAGSTIISYTVTNATGCKKTDVRTQIVEPSYLNVPANASICNGAAYFFGTQVLTNPGIYTERFLSKGGCDSSSLLTLSNVTVDASISQTATALVANEVGATYQWINCATNQPVPGATSRTFTPPAGNGQYQAEITVGDCIIKSLCRSLWNTGIAGFENTTATIYPNPTTGMLAVKLNNAGAGVVTVRDLAGRVLLTQTLVQELTYLNLAHLSNGAYVISVNQEGASQVKMVNILH